MRADTFCRQPGGQQRLLSCRRQHGLAPGIQTQPIRATIRLWTSILQGLTAAQTPCHERPSPPGPHGKEDALCLLVPLPGSGTGGQDEGTRQEGRPGSWQTQHCHSGQAGVGCGVGQELQWARPRPPPFSPTGGRWPARLSAGGAGPPIASRPRRESGPAPRARPGPTPTPRDPDRQTDRPPVPAPALPCPGTSSPQTTSGSLRPPAPARPATPVPLTPASPRWYPLTPGGSAWGHSPKCRHARRPQPHRRQPTAEHQPCGPQPP